MGLGAPSPERAASFDAASPFLWPPACPGRRLLHVRDIVPGEVGSQQERGASFCLTITVEFEKTGFSIMKQMAALEM